MKRLALYLVVSSFGLTVLGLPAETNAQPAAATTAKDETLADYWQLARPDQVCAISSVYEIRPGVGRPPFAGIEYLVKTSIDGRDIWRAVHYSLDPSDMAKTTDGRIFFDVVDADAKTLDVISSTHRVRQTVTAFEHTPSVVTKAASGTRPEEKITLNGVRPVPEGPGGMIFLQSVPWRVGLTMRTREVDRWRGTGQERVRDVRITVLGQESLKVDGRDVPVYKVERRAEDGSFKVESHVTVNRPHREVRIAYYPTASSPPIVSEMRSLTAAANCPT